MTDTVFGNYRLDEYLDEGAMGVVYRGTDLALDRVVAIKFLNSDLSGTPELVQRFRAEARAQAKLNHVNLATLYAFQVHEGRAMMVMEFIQGETIENMINRRGPIPSQEAVPMFRQALLGIGYAHRMGVIHRDIKPSNIMLNDHGIVKVMDFGIAKVMGNPGLTRTGAQLGTPYYVAPEQITNNPVDIRSDIYSLGVTLYEMLSAHVPFPGETDYQILSAHVNTPPPPPSRHYPHIPRGTQNAVLKALEKNPDHRFQSVEEFGAALERTEHFSYVPGVVGSGQRLPPPLPQMATTPEGKYPATDARPPFWTRQRMAVAGICLLLVLVLLGWLLADVGRSRVNTNDEPNLQAKSDSSKRSQPASMPPVSLDRPPQTVAVMVQCDLDCKWTLEGESMGQLKADVPAKFEFRLVKPRQRIEAVTLDGADHDSREISVTPTLHDIKFNLSGKRSEREAREQKTKESKQKQIKEGLSRAKALYEKDDCKSLRESIAAFQGVLQLDPEPDGRKTAEDGLRTAQSLLRNSRCGTEGGGSDGAGLAPETGSGSGRVARDSAPVPIYKPEPKYTEQARIAKIEGAVLLSLVIDEKGNPRDVKVIRPLDRDLDQQAIECVEKWKFRPAMKDGHPVSLQATIEVHFRLL